MTDEMKELMKFMDDMEAQRGSFLRMTSKQDAHLRYLMGKVVVS